MHRRSFIKTSTKTGLVLGLGSLGFQSCVSQKAKKVTILHTNDVHSHIDPFPLDHARNPNKGGVARRAILIESIRKENPHTLLLDAGDMFQGTPYFNFYGGELEFKLMSMLNYDAATIGNHDFDNGIEGLLAQLPHAKFSLISANYDFKNTVLEGFVQPYRIFTLDGIRIGVYGLGIALKGLVTPRLYKETLYNDPYDIAIDTEKKLKEEEQCDIIIALSHLGYKYDNEGNKPDDVTLAAKTKHTHLIIGGHTHTFLEKPSIHTNLTGNEVLVNQVGCYGLNLGRIDFYLSSEQGVSAQGYQIRV